MDTRVKNILIETFKQVKEAESLFVPRHIDKRHEERLEQIRKMFKLSDKLIVEWFYAAQQESSGPGDLHTLDRYLRDFAQQSQVKISKRPEYTSDDTMYMWLFENLTPEKLEMFLSLCKQDFSYRENIPYNLTLETHGGQKVLTHNLDVIYLL